MALENGGSCLPPLIDPRHNHQAPWLSPCDAYRLPPSWPPLSGLPPPCWLPPPCLSCSRSWLPPPCLSRSRSLLRSRSWLPLPCWAPSCPVAVGLIGSFGLCCVFIVSFFILVIEFADQCARESALIAENTQSGCRMIV
jgi:hypothetical protein